MTERRRDSRFGAPLLAHVTITLRPGQVVSVVNLSAGGALVHAARPLRPGAQIDVLIATDTRSLRMAAQVLRCGVVAIEAERGVVYGGALRFESRCEVPWEGEGAPG